MAASAAVSRLKKNLHTLHTIADSKPKLRKALVANADNDLIFCLADCIYNVLQSNVPMTRAQLSKLYKYRHYLRKVAHKRTTMKEKRKVLQQNGGFLPLLLTPLLGIAGSLIGEAISGAVNKQ